MTIRPGAPWGRETSPPEGLVTVHSDRALVDALARPDHPPLAVDGGDLALTLGVAANGHRSTVNEFPVDLLRVRLDGAADPIIACAHVVARSPWSRGHWFRGPIVAVMNVEFIGEWDVAPRGHPNDGRVEVFEVDETMPVRDRLAARRRLRSATHLPHPCVTTRSVRTASWTFTRPLEVIVDGWVAGRISQLHVEVVPDAAVVYA